MSWVMCVLELAVLILHPAFPLAFSTSSSTVLFCFASRSQNKAFHLNELFQMKGNEK